LADLVAPFRFRARYFIGTAFSSTFSESVVNTARHITNREIRDIARNRIWLLLSYAEQEARRGNMTRCRRYFMIARRISMRTNTPLPREFIYCHHCLTPLIPGRNCRVRLRQRRVVIHCLECDSFRRHPYIEGTKERS
jgi:ribonuclease P protein subunit RPR2